MKKIYYNFTLSQLGCFFFSRLNFFSHLHCFVRVLGPSLES